MLDYLSANGFSDAVSDVYGPGLRPSKLFYHREMDNYQNLPRITFFAISTGQIEV